MPCGAVDALHVVESTCHPLNEIYFTANGHAFDAVGVSPDLRVPFFTQEDLQSGRDPALEKALDWLTKPN